MGDRKIMLFAVGLALFTLAEVEQGHGQLVIPAFRVPQCSGGEELPISRNIRSTEQQSGDEKARKKTRMEGFTVAPANPPKVFLPSLNVTLTGEVLTIRNNRTISAYFGIKYGIADRFKHSVLPGRYWGSAAELRVNIPGNSCPQLSPSGNFFGSEDCLYLDIYVPKVDSAMNASAEPLPVMFFIHGGSFTYGLSSFYNPEWILSKNVIVVVIQYRLGTLGWLSLQNDDIPGNAGLSDQITALKWVQEHIASFGGDLNKVTIFGQSAGAASVSLLQTIGPVTRGLFSGVIAQSGSALNLWAIDKKPLESARNFAIEFCKCPNATSSSNIYDCLTALPAKTIVLCTHEMISSQRMNVGAGVAGFAPVVQGKNVSERYRLITKMPEEYITAGEAVDVPIMMGATRDEGSFVLGFVFVDYLLPKNLFNNSNYRANYFISDTVKNFEFKDSPQAVQEKYFPGVNMTSWEAVTPGMIDFLGVSFMKASVYETAMFHSTDYNSSTFFYSFDYESNSSLFAFYFLGYIATAPICRPGVTHGDDLIYLFDLFYEFTAQQWLTSERLVTLWTNFAKYGNPTPIEENNFRALGLPLWPELEPQESKYLLIQNNFTVAVNYSDRWTINMDSDDWDVLVTFPDCGEPSKAFPIIMGTNSAPTAMEVATSVKSAEPSTPTTSTSAVIEASPYTVKTMSATTATVATPVIFDSFNDVQTKSEVKSARETVVVAAMENAGLGMATTGGAATDSAEQMMDTAGVASMEHAALGMETEGVEANEKVHGRNGD